jgi:Cu+-exporting ATPase
MALEPVNLAATTGNTEYTCPMHPQIVRDEPGVCPICGMALEPRDAAADSQNPELINMMRRFWVAAALTLPLIAVMVSDM